MTFSVNGRNLILLIAKKDVKKDEELKYFYGDNYETDCF